MPHRQRLSWPPVHRVALVAALALLAACTSGRAPPYSAGAAPSGDPEDSTEPVARATRSRYGNPSSYEVFGKTYHVMASAEGFTQEGIASWYGRKFHGRRTSSGEPYDMYAVSAAHKSLPLPTTVEVENLRNGRRLVVRVNDRGPFKDNRIIDLSYAAAAKLGIVQTGTAPVRIRALPPGSAAAMGAEEHQDAASAPVAGAPATEESTPANPAVSYYVQVGAFGERANAERLVERLTSAGLAEPAGVYPGEVGERRFYRVRIGPMRAAGSVDNVTGQLDDIGVTSSHVVVADSAQATQ